MAIAYWQALDPFLDPPQETVMARRRELLALGALGAVGLSGCGGGGGGGGRNEAVNTPASAERATGWMQMPAELYAKTLAVTVASRDSERFYDLSDGDFLGLRGWPLQLPTPESQGQLGSCTAWAVGYVAGTQALRSAGQLPDGDNRNALSPADLFGKIQRRPSPMACTQGSMISDAMDVLVQEGAATLASVPYSDRVCPSATAGQTYFLDGFSRIVSSDTGSIRGSIQSHQPVCFGMQVDQAFQRLNTSNKVFVPSGSGGGHAMAVIGYDDARQLYKIQNSWGTDWGAGGYFWISYADFARHANDVCIPYKRRQSENELLAATTSNPSVVVEHMNARRFGSGTPGSYGVGIEMGWSVPLRVDAAEVSLLDDAQNILFAKTFSASQIARGIRFGTVVPDGAASYTIARSTVTGVNSAASTVSLVGTTRPASR